MGLGLVLSWSAIRFIAYGWVDELLVTPDFHFRYWGFGWLALPSDPAPVFYGVFVAMAVLGLCITLGAFTRVAFAGFFLLFTYVELVDVTYYLNHYYLVSLLCLLGVFLPTERLASVDAWRRPGRWAGATVPRWVLWLLRLQIAVVYVYAGVAKIGEDWLVHAQPLNIWLSARTDTPVLGPWLDEWWVALAMSWAGMLHDVLVPFLLLWRRTRAWTYPVVVAFHLVTGGLFEIGLFPILMIVNATVFFEPEWPRGAVAKVGRRFGMFGRSGRLGGFAARMLEAPAGAGADRTRRGLTVVGLAALVAWSAVQVGVPLRAYAYGDDVLWHEQGMRWSWRVMLREKNGAITYRVVRPGETRERQVSPRRYLSDYQEREMSGQPDLILQLAHHIAAELDREAPAGSPPTQVRVDAWVSLNGRPAARLIDPDVDLARVDDGLGKAHWVLPAPSGPPRRLRPAAGRDEARVAREATRRTR